MIHFFVPCFCTTAPPGCKDDASWCSTLFPGQCYDKAVEETCCATCAGHRKPQQGEL